MLQKFASAKDFLSYFDSTKRAVQEEIREGFFSHDGSLKMSQDQINDWLEDRAIDEYKIVHELSLALSAYGHAVPPHFVRKLTEQMGEELGHFQIIRNLLPISNQQSVDSRMQDFKKELQGDLQYKQFVESLAAGDVYGALLSINITHEGYSAAAIEVLKDIPIPAVRDAYGIIGDDEAKHHESGREMVQWLVDSRNLTPKLEGSSLNRGFSQASKNAAGAMDWSWPAPVEKSAVGAMDWSWPAPVEKSAVGAMDWSWPAPVEKSAVGAMDWSWPAPVEKSAVGAMDWSWPAPVEKSAVGAMDWSWPAPVKPQSVSWKMHFPQLKVA